MSRHSSRVAVLMGGPSSERDISIKSGMAVYNALIKNGITAFPVELEGSQTMDGYIDKVKKRLQLFDIEVAFIALHGRFGEDGTIQEILEEMSIPYTGSGVDASRLGMDKIRSKEAFRAKGIVVPDWEVIDKADLNKVDASKFFDCIGETLVIKPSNEGSSIGLCIVDSVPLFYEGLKDAFRYADKVIIEEYVSGRELTVGILDDRPLPVVEIIPKNRFFDFEAKYKKGLTEYKVPAEIDHRTARRCQEIGLMAHEAIGAKSFSRVDMILREDGMPVVLEINTIPGLTETSLLPKAAEAIGIKFEELVSRILETAYGKVEKAEGAFS